MIIKPKLLLSSILFFTLLLCSAQVPQGFNYQAVARDGSGSPITNMDIQVRVSILSDTTGFYSTGNGTYIWEEEHSVHTNTFGLFGLIMGTEAGIQGSACSFDQIDWNQPQLFTGVKIQYPAPTWKNMGTAKLNSVPYVLVAENATGVAPEIESVFPELVVTNEDGYKMVDYTKLAPILIEAVKSQQVQITLIENENKVLRENNTLLTNEIDELKTLRSRVEQLEMMLLNTAEK